MKLATVIERYMKHGQVIPPKRFLDQIAIDYMESHYMQNGTAASVASYDNSDKRVSRRSDESDCRAEQLRHAGQHDERQAFVEQDVATGIEFNTTIYVSSICEREHELLDERELESDGNITFHRRAMITDGTHAQRSGSSAFVMKRIRRVFS